MLEVFFCNVGDGDAVLLREFHGNVPGCAVLVDSGRPYVESREGSLRKDAVEYLLGRGVDRLDRMILTHPHIDHAGGALRILKAVRVGRIEMLAVPPENACRVSRPFTSAVKAENGFRQMLEILRELAEEARAAGTGIGVIRPGEHRLSGDLEMTVYYPRREVAERQRMVFETLYRGEQPEEGILFQAAKERNLASLMLRFRYGRSSVLLAGDRFAADWEDMEIPPCDILMLPHHGDRRSMTGPLLRKLSPRYAVISCENDPQQKKERPAGEIVSLVREQGCALLCTENRPAEGLEGATHNGIRFEAGLDGEIACFTE